MAAQGGARGGWSWVIPTRNLMDDKRYQPTLREFLTIGVGKAHRSVTYSHHEHRNYRRSNLGDTGRVG